jgi:lysyl-tRNA synthetase class 2
MFGMNAQNRRRNLEVRNRVLQTIRRFFADHGFIEVETPVRLPAPALELHIDAEPAGDWYLRTSPELHMKRLLAEGMDRVFQVGPCFRRGECGARHNPEFTMLEWYRANADYRHILADMKALIAAVFAEAVGSYRVEYGGRPIEVMPMWECISVRDAFLQHAGWDVLAAFDPDRFDLDLVNKVEPALPHDRPVVLIDYPIQQAALARPKASDPCLAERWELYIGGLELANAFSELTDAAEQRRRFVACAAERRAAGQPVYPLDEDFLGALEHGMPPCAGVALGVDRLVMLAAGADSIEEVRVF